jgi:hypothetical protein
MSVQQATPFRETLKCEQVKQEAVSLTEWFKCEVKQEAVPLKECFKCEVKQEAVPLKEWFKCQQVKHKLLKDKFAALSKKNKKHTVQQKLHLKEGKLSLK